MTTENALKNVTESDIEQTQNTIVVWLDKNIDHSNPCFTNTITQFQRILSNVYAFTDNDQCIEFILNITDYKVCMITSKLLGQIIMPCIHDIFQIDSFLIFPGNENQSKQWVNKWSKIKVVSTDVSSICQALKQLARQSEQSDIHREIKSLTCTSSDPKQESELSYFYNACRSGDLSLVELFLEEMSIEEINYIEVNGETALHAAASNSHDDIVKLLLKNYAFRSIKDSYDRTPYDVAKKSSTKQLFVRESGADRFGGHPAELTWMRVDPKAAEWAAFERHRLSDRRHFVQKIDTILDKYLSQELYDTGGIDLIKYFCWKSREEQDPIYLLKAYTAQTPFVNVLNEGLATKPSSGDSRSGRRAYISAMSHPDFERLIFTGITYRGMRLTEENLAQYSVGNRIMNYSFLSTSKLRAVAETFACVGEHADGKLSALCTYIIKNRSTALAIEEVSEYQFEEEVLILPYSAFEVTLVHKTSMNKDMMNIVMTFEECDLVEPYFSGCAYIAPDVYELWYQNNRNECHDQSSKSTKYLRIEFGSDTEGSGMGVYINYANNFQGNGSKDDTSERIPDAPT
ncbi:unnamed protein product [Adineta ricciae]|uniref:NAD(+)--protein-arginine ADP-ribosyltransferase n=1 Tax=Adineta ricciae TaxID=249248 RepID=A0A815ZBJ9_ADIRI|nr:unnamed protein product [Adineta ricciae]CAF1580641.1 unnamed protein product [Adineta ricciae]